MEENEAVEFESNTQLNKWANRVNKQLAELKAAVEALKAEWEKTKNEKTKKRGLGLFDYE